MKTVLIKFQQSKQTECASSCNNFHMNTDVRKHGQNTLEQPHCHGHITTLVPPTHLDTNHFNHWHYSPNMFTKSLWNTLSTSFIHPHSLTHSPTHSLTCSLTFTGGGLLAQACKSWGHISSPSCIVYHEMT